MSRQESRQNSGGRRRRASEVKAMGPSAYFACHIIDNPVIPLAVHRSRIISDTTVHCHDFIEIAFVVRGSALHTWYGDDCKCNYEIHIGDVFVVSPGERHGFGRCRDLLLYNLMFDPSLLAEDMQYFNDFKGLNQFLQLEPASQSPQAARYKLHLDTNNRLILSELLDELIDVLQRREAGYGALAKAGFLEFLARIGRCYEKYSCKFVNVDSLEHFKKIDHAIAFMEKHFTEQLSVSDIAKEACLSPKYFGELFKRITGSSPGDYLIALRSDEAARRLRCSDESVTNIAYASGFCDGSYFARVFKSRFNQTPSEYRKSGKSS